MALAMTIAGKKLSAEVDNVLTGVDVEYGLGQVAKLQVTLTDAGGLMAKNDLARWGTEVRTDAGPWQVGGLKQTLRPGGSDWEVRSYSALAKSLRDNWRSKVAGVKSTDWVSARVRAAGGRTIVQASARKAKLDAADDRTVLDAVDALASDLGWSWCEYDGLLVFMDPWWAWQNPGVKLPAWEVTWGAGSATNATALEVDMSNEDDAAFGTGSLTMPASAAAQIRPLHTVQLGEGITGPHAGWWVVTSASRSLRRPDTPVTLEIARPRKGIPQDRTSTPVSTGSGGALTVTGQWIDGKDKVWPGCTRTPAQYVAWAQSQVGQGWPDRRCLAWVSTAVKGREGAAGGRAVYAWTHAPAGTPKSPGDTSPPIGAIVVWGPPTGGTAGHIGISIGGGRFISATGGRVQNLSIAGFGTYLGAMAPNFGGSYPAY